MAGILLAFAYPDRIAKLRNLGSTDKDRRYLLSNGKGAVFTNHDILANGTLSGYC